MDRQLWQNIIEGDRLAYEKLYVDCFKRFYNYGKKFTGDIVLIEDSIQEVFLDIWSHKQKALNIESPDSYLFSSFRYILFKKIKLANNSIAVTEANAEPEFSVEQVIISREENKETEKKLSEALRSLTSRQREAIFLRFYEGLSYEEIAVVLNITVKASYKIMARSLLNLKEKLSFPFTALLLVFQLAAV
jgi:RNA polymerase sigma factor (sigma-70 family)